MSLSLVLLLAACSQGQTKTAIDVGTKIADAVCKEEAEQPAEPDWVKLACAAEGIAGGVVHVLMPREEWNVVRGRKPKPCTTAPPPAFDAGPGK